MSTSFLSTIFCSISRLCSSSSIDRSAAVESLAACGGVTAFPAFLDVAGGAAATVEPFAFDFCAVAATA